MQTDTDSSAAASGEAVLPRWPVFIRFGDGDEVAVADVFAGSTGELLTGMAGALRELADYLEHRAGAL